MWKTKLEIFAIPRNLKNDKSCGNQYLENICRTELGISNKKCGKQNLKYLQFLEIWKNDKSCGNQFFENILLTELGILIKKCGEQNLKYLQLGCGDHLNAKFGL